MKPIILILLSIISLRAYEISSYDWSRHDNAITDLKQDILKLSMRVQELENAQPKKSVLLYRATQSVPCTLLHGIELKDGEKGRVLIDLPRTTSSAHFPVRDLCAFCTCEANIKSGRVSFNVEFLIYTNSEGKTVDIPAVGTVIDNIQGINGLAADNGNEQARAIADTIRIPSGQKATVIFADDVRLNLNEPKPKG